MAFKSFERGVLSLSVIMLSSAYTAAYAQDPVEKISPASPEACVGLESNADRLACYDAVFKVPVTEVKPKVAEPVLVKQAAAKQEPQTTHRSPP